jgi:DNA-directed RNA polymerase specialized sigma24 family protein
VVHAGSDASQAGAAMDQLCRQYWYPLYAYVRRQGRDHHEAEDCTQEFLSRLLAGDGVARARRERGRFRTFLLTALRNFLTNEWHRAHAEKRARGLAPLSLDRPGADERFALEPADAGYSPDQAFDRTWAHGMIATAIGLLRTEYEKSGRGVLFASLAPLVWGNPNPESLALQASRLGQTEQAFAVALHRLRRRLGERLRAAVAETVASDSEVDTEVRHLISALGTTGTAQ